MLTLRKYLTQYLLKLQKWEEIIQKIRLKITQNTYFQSQTVFQRMDKFDKKYLIPSDLSEFMLQNQIYPTQQQLYLIFKTFDFKKQGIITYESFCQQILPKQNIIQKEKVLKRKKYVCKQKLTIQLQFLLSQYFQNKINQIKQLTILQQNIKSQLSYNIQQAFNLIDASMNYVIHQTTPIDIYLRNNGKQLNIIQLRRIFRKLSMNNQYIDFDIFKQQIDPFGQLIYSGYQIRRSQDKEKRQLYYTKKIAFKQQLYKIKRQKQLLNRSINALTGNLIKNKIGSLSKNFII